MADAAGILLARHEQLRSRPGAAAEVLRLVADADASAQDLAHVIGTDPVLAARALRVANSPFYGVGGRVATLPYAVTVLGFQTVRSLAVVAAANLDGDVGVPPGYWRAAALAATAAEEVAGVLGGDRGQAFSVGLLHTIGSALLHQHEPLGLVCLPEPADAAALAAVELEQYGITHDHAAARVLSSWHLPDKLTELVARHHELPLPDASPLERSLRAGRVIADAVLRGGAGEDCAAQLAWLTEGALAGVDLAMRLELVSSRADALLEGLQPRHR